MKLKSEVQKKEEIRTSTQIHGDIHPQSDKQTDDIDFQKEQGKIVSMNPLTEMIQMDPAVSTISAKADKPQRKPRNPPDKQKLIELAESNPNLSTRKLAKIMDCDRATIHRALERFGCRKELVDQYKEYRADILAGLQGRLLAKITAEDIEKAGLRDKVVAFGILMDKERLENGLSTQNHAVIMASAVMEAEKMSKKKPDVDAGI